MEEVIGRSIGDERALEESPVPRPELARRMLSSFIGQVLDDALYHADPHPGNVMIDAAGSIWLLDFGAVGRLDGRSLEGLRGIALGVATRDSNTLARAVRHLAGEDSVVDLRSLEDDLATTLTELEEGGGIDPQLDRPGARSDAASRAATAGLDVVARARPGDAGGDAQDHLARVQPRRVQPPGGRRRAPGRLRNAGGDHQAGGDAQPAVPAHAPRACRDDRRPAARRTPHGPDGTLRRRRPRRRRPVGGSSRDRRDRRSGRPRLGHRAARGRRHATITTSGSRSGSWASRDSPAPRCC